MKTVEELRQIASDMTSDTNNVNKYLSESPRIANFLIGYDYASSHSMESQWISVEERLPEDNSPVLVIDVEYNDYYGIASYSEENKWAIQGTSFWKPTHWKKINPPSK